MMMNKVSIDVTLVATIEENIDDADDDYDYGYDDDDDDHR